MASHVNRNRRIEAALSLAVVSLLACALLLVYAGKRADEGHDPILVNSATADRFAVELGIDEDLANRIVAYRTAVGGFSSGDQLPAVPLFSREEAERLTKALEASRLNPRTATARQFARALGLSTSVANRLLQYRGTLTAAVTGNAPQGAPAGRLPVNWLRRAPLLDPDALRPQLDRLQVRKPSTVCRQFALLAFGMLLAAFLFPPWLRSRCGGDPFLVPLALLLAGLGAAIMFSIKDPLRDQAVYLHHGIGTLLGLAAMTAMARLSPTSRKHLKRYAYLWALAATGLVVLLFVAGHGPENVRLNLFGFQPVEIIKLLLVLFLASYLADRADLIADTTPSVPENTARVPRRLLSPMALPRRKDIGPVCVMFALAMMLFYVVKDLGPAVLLFGTFVTVLYLTTGRSAFIRQGIALLVVGGVLGYYLHVGVYPTRVDMWQHPFANTHPTGMQLGQSYWAMASGGMEGMGLGMGDPGLLPRAGSDLAFASWAEETGLMGVWLVLTVYVVLVWRGTRIALQATNSFDRALAFGLTALLALQTAFIVGGVTGVFPLSGIALPFLSYGNSALLADFLLIGLLRGVSATTTVEGQRELRPEVTTAARRFALSFAVFLIGFIGIVRMGAIQSVHADAIAGRAIVTPDADKVARPHINPRLLAVASRIERGSIYDRNGQVLATSRQAEILHAVHDGREARRLVDGHVRLYPFGGALAHLVGYLDPAVGGPAGMERGYNNELRGFQRYEELLPDYRNAAMPLHRPRKSRNLVLTVDAPLQSRVSTILQQTTADLRDTRTGKPKQRAAFVLIQPETGDVLVAASIPTFDPNTLTPTEYARLISGDGSGEHALINRATQGLYPPGSTLKVATAACALDNLPGATHFAAVCNQVSGTIRWHTHSGNIILARSDIHDDKGDPPFGSLTLAHAFRVSSNIYFATLAAAIGPSTLRATLADKMAFRHVPSPGAFDADLPDIGYGQGRMLASPLEMARLAGSPANGGLMMESRFVNRLEDSADPHTARTMPVRALSQAMTAGTAATLRRMMRSVVEIGTAKGSFDDLRVRVAGKTGTAQNHQYDHEPHSWFIGFAPYSSSAAPQPSYAFACCVENGGYGRRVAAVICDRVLRGRR